MNVTLTKGTHMAYGRVRIYEGPGETNIIGFSPSAIPEAPADAKGFFENRGYETANVTDTAVISKLAGASFAHIGIEPPLKPEDAQAFGEWCSDNIDLGHNSGLLIDNRAEFESVIKVW